MKNNLKNALKKAKNVEILFTDILGNSRTLLIPKNKLKSAIKNGLKCDGSSIYSQNEVNNSDLDILLDNRHFYFLPNGNLLIFANTNNKYDARQNLLIYENELNNKKFFVNIGAELEFFLFDRTNIAKNNHFDKNLQKKFAKNNDNLNYFQFSNDSSYFVINEILHFCKHTNIEIEQCHHECANNQYEIDFKYDTPTNTADKIIYLKKIISFFAEKHNLYACFLPKPIKNQSGSGMHVNISVVDSHKKNLFYSQYGKFGLSDFAWDFANNINKHICAITAVANPIENSYDRLNAKIETPSKICINRCDRSALIRVPNSSKKNTRIELRSPDVSCNPYLTFSCIIRAGFENKNSNKNAIMGLPKNLDEALCFLKNDEYINRYIPKNYYKICKKR